MPNAAKFSPSGSKGRIKPPLKGLAGVAVLDGVQLLNAGLRRRIAPEGSGAVCRIPGKKAEANSYHPSWLPDGGAGRPNGLTEGVWFVEW